MVNTEFTYLYRDASNWKQFETIILEGEMSTEDIDLIMSRLEDEDLFLPEQVGLQRLQHRWGKLNEDDHAYHELNREDIKIVDLPSTTPMTAKELVENFRTVSWDIQRSVWTLWIEAEVDENADMEEILQSVMGRVG